MDYIKSKKTIISAYIISNQLDKAWNSIKNEDLEINLSTIIESLSNLILTNNKIDKEEYNNFIENIKKRFYCEHSDLINFINLLVEYKKIESNPKAIFTNRIELLDKIVSFNIDISIRVIYFNSFLTLVSTKADLYNKYEKDFKKVLKEYEDYSEKEEKNEEKNRIN